MGWIDSHCHLDFSEFTQFDSLMDDLRSAGCSRVLVPAISRDTFDRVLQFQNNHAAMTDIALGMHPYFMSKHEPDDLMALEKYLVQYDPNAVGEIGLDYLLDKNTWESQQYLFEQQVTLAKAFSKPIVVHSRKAHDQVHSILKRLQFDCGGLIHGFSGSLQQAQRYLDLGFALGLGGALTHERAKAMHKLVAQLPMGSFVLETDSPDMLPSFAEGINTPLNVPGIAEHIARLRQEDVETIYEQTSSIYERIIRRL